MLQVRDIHTYYGDSYILQGVSLDVAEGQVTALLGRNGVGKTTLVRSIIGFTPPRRGQVLLDGADLARLPAHRIAQQGVGLVPQGRRIFGSLTVKENLDVAVRPSTSPHAWGPAEVFAFFPRLRERLQFRGRSLSGGEQQMLACGRALVGNPRILLLDEPTEGLSPLFVQELGRLIRRVREQGVAVLLIEQNLAFALSLADRASIMSKGSIVWEGGPGALEQDEETKARYLGL